MSSFLRKAVSRYVPSHFQDPFGLAMRLLRSRDPAARFAMETALLGLLLTPLDLLLQLAETRRYRRAGEPKLPLILVCGPPRSATTLVAQVLIKNLPVAHINNLTSLFPRSPLTASSLFGRFIGKPAIAYQSYYGKTPRLSGINDGLYLWDRWLGADRKAVPEALGDGQKQAMRSFFGACEAFFQKPLVNKNNHLSTCAHLVAEVLENAFFLCLTRDPRYLAQSQLKARYDMYGDPSVAYGAEAHRAPGMQVKDYVEDVCSQILFYQRAVEEEARLIGPERFWLVSYETFCRQPAELVEQVATRILRQPVDRGRLEAELKPFETSRKLTIDAEVFSRIERSLARLQECGSSLQAAGAG